ncbi:PAS domain S-box protein [Archangium violaceum]|uniref:PAS domain S-box protein n=1 Tax=Archangium violaceum TaxID=83451 RepID=UPI00193C06AB|nr:PAS domain S-box protein [Archangium violaceum]QRK11569.1 PAS domain S-box protein [Archangium violaceum]
MTVPEFIVTQRGVIIERWLHGMAALVTPRRYTREELIDSLPRFLEELTGALLQLDGSPGSSQLPGHSVVAKAHGRQRLRLGLDVGVIVREYALLREVILEFLAQAGMDLAEPHARLLARCIDTGAAEAVSQYVREEERRERRARAESQAHEDSATREDEERVRLLLDSVLDYALFLLTVDGRVSSWNPGAERLVGYAEEEILGQPLARFFPREEMARGTAEHLLRDATSEGRAEHEGRLVRKDGSTFWANLTLREVEDAAGQPRGFSAVARDLSERRRADLALRESEERFRMMVDSVQDYALFGITPEGIVSGWNPGAQRLKGYTAEEAIGQHINRFFPREVVEQGEARRILAHAHEKNGAEYEGWLVRKDRSCFWGSLILDPIRDETGQLKGFANIAHDLTERKRTEQTQTLLAEAGEALAGSLDVETIAQQMAQIATPELSDWCVVSLAEGPHLRPVAVAHADKTRQPLLQRVVQPLPAEPSSPHGPVHVVHTGQVELIPDAAGAPWFAEALGIQPAGALTKLGTHAAVCVPLKARGETFGAMTFVQEGPPPRGQGLTDRGLIEAIAHRAALALDNARLYAEAMRRADFERHLVGIVSHDLSTPISAMGLGVELLLADRELTPRQRTTLERMDQATQRARRLIRDLLDFTQARVGGGLPVNPQPLELHGLARTVLEELTSANPARQVRLTSSGDTRGSWDPDRLAQVITNLVNNALSYSPPGTAVHLEVLGEGEALHLRVHNEGDPIPPGLLPRLFEPLERGARPGTGGRSIGLGLFIVDHIARAHGGVVEVRSEPREGTTFTVRLPRQR